MDYLCRVANEYFRTEIGAADVVWAFAGVRSLYDNGARKAQDVGRDYELILEKRYGEAPLLTVYGGKMTTYRRIAEQVLARLRHFFPHSRPWTAQSHLPGGNFVYDGLERWLNARCGLGRSCEQGTLGGWCEPMAAVSSACLRISAERRIWARVSAPILPPPKCAI